MIYYISMIRQLSLSSLTAAQKMLLTKRWHLVGDRPGPRELLVDGHPPAGSGYQEMPHFLSLSIYIYMVITIVILNIAIISMITTTVVTNISIIIIMNMISTNNLLNKYVNLESLESL